MENLTQFDILPQTEEPFLPDLEFNKSCNHQQWFLRFSYEQKSTFHFVTEMPYGKKVERERIEAKTD